MTSRPKKDSRVPTTVLGVEIGTMSGYDFVDNMALIFYDFSPNEIGQKFLKTTKETDFDLTVDLERGVVATYIKVHPQGEYEENAFAVDWGALNQK